MARTRWEVLPTTKTERRNGFNRWKATREGEVIGTFRTQGEAIMVAVTTARCAWKLSGTLATLKIKGRDGKIRDERTYGADPTTTKG